MSIVGSIKRVAVNGTAYDAAADSNLTQNPPKMIEGIATSGKTMMKVTRQVATVESITVIADGLDYQLLLTAVENAANGETYPISYTEASGDVYRATGTINLESRETETGAATITFIPEGDWTFFSA